MVRAMMSVAPPGTNGTIRRTKRVGHAWANVARTPRLETRAEAADEPSKQRRLIMAFLPAGFLRAISGKPSDGAPRRQAHCRRRLIVSRTRWRVPTTWDASARGRVPP